MSTGKSDKELAFLQDLYVSTDWGERFAELFDEHVELPEKGRALYVESGTGGHAMALQERAGEEVKLLCVDESEECLELARAKAVAMNAQTEFRVARLDGLYLRDDQFDLVLGDGSLVSPSRLPVMLSEMVRVAVPGGTVALSLATASSFGEFFSVYWEALRNAGLEQQGNDVEKLISELPTVSDVEALAERAGLDAVTSWTRIEEFDYGSGEDFLNSPLITDFLFKAWLGPLPESVHSRVSQEIARIIDEDRHGMDFALSVKATLVVGRKK
ncbi:MAG TPA: class I SAM-dependent methyltransferase [Pyrinomonadaceae bacterium]|nr:class I SAM-dependent methyltransferase [Pyrinomonadaceae bacterium]